MLENDGLGARSGVSPLVGFVRSQKYWKVRSSRVSRNAAARAESGGGGPAGWLDAQARMAARTAGTATAARAAGGIVRASLTGGLRGRGPNLERSRSCRARRRSWGWP